MEVVAFCRPTNPVAGKTLSLKELAEFLMEAFYSGRGLARQDQVNTQRSYKRRSRHKSLIIERVL